MRRPGCSAVRKTTRLVFRPFRQQRGKCQWLHFRQSCGVKPEKDIVQGIRNRSLEASSCSDPFAAMPPIVTRSGAIAALATAYRRGARRAHKLKARDKSESVWSRLNEKTATGLRSQCLSRDFTILLISITKHSGHSSKRRFVAKAARAASPASSSNCLSDFRSRAAYSSIPVSATSSR